MIKIRTATLDDAEKLVAIYAPYVEQTAITFEYVAPSIEEFRKRIGAVLEKLPYLVAEIDDEIVGYIYASPFKARPAYNRTVETSIYVKMDNRKHGVGRALYDEMEKKLKGMGILNMNACTTWIDTPNQYLTHNSPEFHQHLGFTQCAHFHKCGYKFGIWFDILWFEKMLGEHEEG
ncbi:MAG: N-acetyltransferase family protein [Paludibacteraceae bacterium]|nr:N-acetyltransferase family protein [Paludibacteraceae bacterium]